MRCGDGDGDGDRADGTDANGGSGVTCSIAPRYANECAVALRTHSVMLLQSKRSRPFSPSHPPPPPRDQPSTTMY